jgi:osmotically-inducible protein OsmY
VPTPGQRDRLADAISKLPGVTRVDDQLEVKNIVPTWQKPMEHY